MSKELFVSSTPHETKVAVVEDDQLAEIYFERENEYTLAGSVYKGRVTRVLPGMQSAFIDIGLERDAFLYVTDFLEEQDSEEDIETTPAPQQQQRGDRRERPRQQAGPVEPIEAPIEAEEALAREAEEMRRQAEQAQGAGIDSAESAEEELDDEAEGEEQATAEGEEGSGEQQGEGVRRWRGRRRRGRRRGHGQPDQKPEQQGEPRPEQQLERPAQRSEEPRAAADAPRSAGQQFGPPAGYQPIILPGESIAKFARAQEHAAAPARQDTYPAKPADTHAAGAEESSHARAPEGGAPQREQQSRGRGDDRRDRRGPRRDEGRRDEGREQRFRRESPSQSYGAPAGYQPIILPGESIAKYRGVEPVRPATPESTIEQEKSEHTHSPAVETGLAQSPENVTGDEAAGAQQRSSVETGLAPSQTEVTRHSPSPTPGEFNESRARNRFKTEEERKEHSGSDDEAPEQQDRHTKYEQMNVAAIFGGAAAEADERSVETGLAPSHENDTGLAPSHENDTGLAPSQENDTGLAPSQENATGRAASDEEEVAATSETKFAPGFGHLEEEEIEEEEADTPSLQQEFEDAEFEELEEQIMDRVAERAGEVAAGLQLSEVVEETETENQAELADEGVESASHEAEEREAAEEPDSENESENEESSGPNGRAELRAPAGVAGYQQRADRNRQFDRGRGGRGRRGGRRMGGGPRRYEPQRPLPQINELLKEGQEVLIQIAKEPIGKKGARITSHIALPGRFLVYMPTVNHIGVSRKISSEEERQRLKRIVISERENGHGGFIVRTAADRADENELRADIRFLKGLWHEIRERAEKAKPPALIYHDLNLVERILRDQVNQNFSTIWVDTEPEYERVVRFVGRFQPSLAKRVKLYTKETPLFEQFGIQEEVNKSLKSKVWLKSGGYIVINQTEALVAIDVNTGKYVGKTARLEDTIVKTNVDAIREIVRQIRLRDLGGIIVIDFIDMDERRNRQKVMQALEEALTHDRAPSKVLQFNDFGLVAITRKRVKQSLERTLGSPCPYCSATGLVKSVTTLCNEIWVEMRKMQRHFDHPDVMLRVNPEVAKALKSNNGRWIQEIEELVGRNLIVKSDPTLHQEQFDIT